MTESIDGAAVFYPWHNSLRENIQAQHQADHMSHAMLFTGAEHLGKRDFALSLAAFLLCRQPSQQACGECKQCRLLAAGTHPDIKLLEPEEGASQIKIAQVRGLINWVSQTAQLSGFKVAIINPAQQMNVQSANALLKCLEEPTAKTLLVLITSRPASLLPTIRSRCHHYPFPIPETELALSWLESQGTKDAERMLAVAGGIPLAVIRKFDADYIAVRALVINTLEALLKTGANPLLSTTKLNKLDMEAVFQVIQEVLADSIKMKLTGSGEGLKNQDALAKIKAISDFSAVERLYAAFDRAGQDLRALRSTSNPNKLLLLESFLIDYQQGKLTALGEQSG